MQAGQGNEVNVIADGQKFHIDVFSAGIDGDGKSSGLSVDCKTVFACWATSGIAETG
jgi:hypothetical protein